MEIFPIEHPDFRRTTLALARGTGRKPAHLVLNGQPKYGGLTYTMVRDDKGKERKIKFAGFHPFDPLPPLKIDDSRIDVVKPIPILLGLWLMFPFLMIPIGGALGPIVGGTTIFCNFRVIRSDSGRADRYMVSAIINFGSFGLYLCIGLLLARILR